VPLSSHLLAGAGEFDSYNRRDRVILIELSDLLFGARNEPMHVSDLMIVLGLAIVVVGWIGHYYLFKMARAVNSHPSEHEHFSMWWWTFGKMSRLYGAHRKIYPEDRTRTYFVSSYGLALALMITCTLLAAKALSHR
jgi:hypothetical protein